MPFASPTVRGPLTPAASTRWKLLPQKPTLDRIRSEPGERKFSRSPDEQRGPGTPREIPRRGHPGATRPQRPSPSRTSWSDPAMPWPERRPSRWPAISSIRSANSTCAPIREWEKPTSPGRSPPKPTATVRARSSTYPRRASPTNFSPRFGATEPPSSNAAIAADSNSSSSTIFSSSSISRPPNSNFSIPCNIFSTPAARSS